MDGASVSVSTAPVLLGLIILGMILQDAIRPKRVIKLRTHWIAPEQVARIAGDGGAEARGPVLVVFVDGTQVEICPKEGETTAKLRDTIGRAIQKRKDLKD